MVLAVTILWKNFASPNICKVFFDKLTRIPEINQEIFFIKNVAKHIKLLNGTSKYYKKIYYKKAGQKGTKGKLNISNYWMVHQSLKKRYTIDKQGRERQKENK